MALPPGWNWLTGNVQELFEHIWNNARRPNQAQQPLLKFWSEPIRHNTISISNLYSFPQPKQPPFTTWTAPCLHSMTILLLQSSHCVVNGKASKCGPCFSSGTNQLIFSTSPLKSDAHLPATHFIFLHYQPELYANRSNPHYPGIQRLAQRLLEANAKYIRGKSGLVLAEIY